MRVSTFSQYAGVITLLGFSVGLVVAGVVPWQWVAIYLHVWLIGSALLGKNFS